MLRYELPIWRIRSYMYFAGLGIHGLVQRAGFDHLRWSKTQSGLRWARLHRTYGKKQHTPGLRKWFGVKIFTWSCQDLRVMIDWCTNGVYVSSVQTLCWLTIIFFYYPNLPNIFGIITIHSRRLSAQQKMRQMSTLWTFGPLPRWRQR